MGGLRHRTEMTATTLSAQDPASAAISYGIVVSDHYSSSDGYEQYYPYNLLAEIYRPTTLKVAAVDSDSTTFSGCEYGWAVDGSTWSDTTVQLTFNTLGWHQVDLTATCHESSSSIQAHGSFYVMVKHVRREIRSLSDDDRRDFFTAMETVFRLDQAEGERLHGPNFRSIGVMVREHLRGAADRTCDHWHDDAGIMTHHMSFALEFEQSLQSVMPHAAMHYWDYTIDSLEEDWTRSTVFEHDWFGTASPENDDHVITDGRWSYLPVMQESGQFSEIHNPYGLLRSPWNTNPTPYVLRHRQVLGLPDGGWTLPSCSQFTAAFKLNSTAEIFNMLNGDLHGPVHIMLGGHWSFDEAHRNLSNAFRHVSSSRSIAADFLLSSKLMWREGKIRCPEVCSSDTPASHCSCSCPADVLSAHWDAENAFTLMGLFGLDRWLHDDAFYRESNETVTQLFNLLCHVGHAGEMFTSAAPYDPMFWPIHGNSERFLSLRRLVAKRGLAALDESWGYVHSDGLPSDTNLVCDWTNVKGMELPTCTKGACPGHRARDLLPMSVEDINGTRSFMTNQEFYLFSSPDNDNLPYAYDSYSEWQGCSRENVSFY